MVRGPHPLHSGHRGAAEVGGAGEVQPAAGAAAGGGAGAVLRRVSGVCRVLPGGLPARPLTLSMSLAASALRHCFAPSGTKKKNGWTDVFLCRHMPCNFLPFNCHFWIVTISPWPTHTQITQFSTAGVQARWDEPAAPSRAAVAPWDNVWSSSVHLGPSQARNLNKDRLATKTHSILFPPNVSGVWDRLLSKRKTKVWSFRWSCFFLSKISLIKISSLTAWPWALERVGRGRSAGTPGKTAFCRQ